MSEENCRECSNTHECPCRNVKCKYYKRCCDCLAKHLSHGGLPACAKNVVKAKEE